MDQPTQNDGFADSQSSQAPQKFMDMMVRPGTTNHVKAKIPAKSLTLMRAAVNKPSHDYAHKLASQPKLADQPEDKQVIGPKQSVGVIDPNRLARADYASRSDQISRFTPSSQISEQPEPVEAEPTAEVREEVVQPPTHQPSMDVFDGSLHKASAEHEPALGAHKQKRGPHIGKITTALMISVVVLLVGGFFVFQNFNRIDLYVAGTKAGFAATSPGYNPSGFDLGSISSGAGIIQTSYHSNSDNRNYSITEKKVNWDSNTLLDSYVLEVAGQNYVTVQSAGRTVYLYGSRNATWVNGGIWYVIKSSNNSLSDQQLIEIATSM